MQIRALQKYSWYLVESRQIKIYANSCTPKKIVSRYNFNMLFVLPTFLFFFWMSKLIVEFWKCWFFFFNENSAKRFYNICDIVFVFELQILVFLAFHFVIIYFVWNHIINWKVINQALFRPIISYRLIQLYLSNVILQSQSCVCHFCLSSNK